ncbi:hypothetical protein B10328_11720 [Campylobacter coli]|nr:hypothetical protein cco71_03212 [Campylobacter coli 317/04]BEJ71935.1 hypothetical protein B10328_11720 [Campylobacter coli]
MAKIPVHVVTGFLGSGKTTFLKEILTDQALNDIALVNQRTRGSFFRS